nr:MFS transporter [Lachnospiraceae bacterium]
ENFILALSREPVLWVIAQVIGWILVPVMSTNLEVILRNSVPVELQGRVYACRNTFQFFTIPIGLFLGGLMVDEVCEPFMESHSYLNFLTFMFGSGKGSGAALMMFVLGISGVIMCLVTGQRLKKYHYSDD